ncbi:MAG: class I SAM-dependent methyltransferase [Chitinophagaceae bacterium]|nr:class I SAM-dependent methyltransferase [Chitinophagaceae bacterium]MCB9046546.1 class I SAM-dependent methyltransferase [Chitinophagales bacterium]
MSTEQEYFEINRALWNEKTKHHTGSEFYDMEGWLKGVTSLKEPELALLGDVRGKDILHLQCHFGQDSLSLARMGARVTGTDISDEAIAYAQKLNDELKLDARFVRSDTYAVPENVREQFDIVFASYGVIGWLPDMQRWADVVAKMLKPGGWLVFVEFHPVVWMYDSGFSHIQYSYFNLAPIIENEQGTYADRNADMQMEEIGWNHAMSDVLQSLINAGLSIEQVREYDYSPCNCFANTEQVEPGKWQIKGIGGKIPMMYSLMAVKQLQASIL